MLEPLADRARGSRLQALPKVLRRAARWTLNQLRSAATRALYSFDLADLERTLRALSLQAGDTVLVHSAYESFTGFTGAPSDIIKLLQRIVGPEGTLMVPTMAFSGTALDYARAGGVLNIRRTPSRMGLLSELIRRMPEVHRSLHPTHPIAIWGRDAEAIAAAHLSVHTPCGVGSPFDALYRAHGKQLYLGCGIEVSTFFHYIEERLEHRMPASPFTAETIAMTVCDASGRRHTVTNRLFDPSMSRRRNLSPLKQALVARREWRQVRVGRLQVAICGAEAMLGAAEALAAKGVFCYDP